MHNIDIRVIGLVFFNLKEMYKRLWIMDITSYLFCKLVRWKNYEISLQGSKRATLKV